MNTTTMPFEASYNLTLPDLDNPLSSLETTDTGFDSSLPTDNEFPYDFDIIANNKRNNNKQRFQQLLREKEHALYLALQDVRQLRNELERLKQSETWYRTELRQQQNNQLQCLQRHYLQQRRQVQQNQRLQRECLTLYTRCGDLERELQLQRQRTLQQLAVLQGDTSINAVEGKTLEEQQFEFLHQNSLIAEQQQLIEVLRRQKHTLMQELQELTQQKDAQLLTLQANLAHKELSGQKCQEFISVQAKERCELQSTLLQLRQQLHFQQQLLKEKEFHIEHLQQHSHQELDAQPKENMDELHRLSLVYNDELNAESRGMKEIRKELLRLDTSFDECLMSQEELKEKDEEMKKNEEQMELKNGNFIKRASTKREISAEKAQENSNREREKEEKKAAYVEEFTEKTIEIIRLNQEYANLCSLYEKIRYELQSHENLEAREDREKQIIEKLRTHLKDHVNAMKTVLKRITELDNERTGQLNKNRETVGYEQETNADESEEEKNEYQKERENLQITPNKFKDDIQRSETESIKKIRTETINKTLYAHNKCHGNEKPLEKVVPKQSNLHAVMVTRVQEEEKILKINKNSLITNVNDNELKECKTMANQLFQIKEVEEELDEELDKNLQKEKMNRETEINRIKIQKELFGFEESDEDMDDDENEVIVAGILKNLEHNIFEEKPKSELREMIENRMQSNDIFKLEEIPDEELIHKNLFQIDETDEEECDILKIVENSVCPKCDENDKQEKIKSPEIPTKKEEQMVLEDSENSQRSSKRKISENKELEFLKRDIMNEELKKSDKIETIEIKAYTADNRIEIKTENSSQLHGTEDYEEEIETDIEEELEEDETSKKGEFSKIEDTSREDQTIHVFTEDEKKVTQLLDFDELTSMEEFSKQERSSRGKQKSLIQFKEKEMLTGSSDEVISILENVQMSHEESAELSSKGKLIKNNINVQNKTEKEVNEQEGKWDTDDKKIDEKYVIMATHEEENKNIEKCKEVEIEAVEHEGQVLSDGKEILNILKVGNNDFNDEKDATESVDEDFTLDKDEEDSMEVLIKSEDNEFSQEKDTESKQAGIEDLEKNQPLKTEEILTNETNGKHITVPDENGETKKKDDGLRKNKCEEKIELNEGVEELDVKKEVMVQEQRKKMIKNENEKHLENKVSKGDDKLLHEIFVNNEKETEEVERASILNQIQFVKELTPNLENNIKQKKEHVRKIARQNILKAAKLLKVERENLQKNEGNSKEIEKDQEIEIDNTKNNFDKKRDGEVEEVPNMMETNKVKKKPINVKIPEEKKVEGKEMNDNKMQLLKQVQADFQMLQEQLTTTQTLAEQQSNQLTQSRTELEQLNNLFAEQNALLQATHKQLVSSETKQHQIIEEVQALCKQLQQNVTCATDTRTTILEQQKQVYELKLQLQKLQQERETHISQMQHLERELSKHKRRALLIPDPNEANGTMTDSNNTTPIDGQITDRLRILSKVLDAEQRRKMQHYDLHIRSLLSNIKGLKRSLRLAEKRAAAQKQTEEYEAHLKQLQNVIDVLKKKYAESQEIIKTLKQKSPESGTPIVHNESDKSFSVDTSMGSAQETSNFINDYKKFIHDSSKAKERPKTKSIMELIERSDNFVPNFDKLKENLDGLQSDLNRFLPKRRYRAPTLAEELHAAGEKTHSSPF